MLQYVLLYIAGGGQTCLAVARLPEGLGSCISNNTTPVLPAHYHQPAAYVLGEREGGRERGEGGEGEREGGQRFYIHIHVCMLC